MNDPSDTTLKHSSATPDPGNCSLGSIVGMSSCRGRAEAFARRLSSKLRTLGSQGDDADVTPEDEAIINGGNTNTWLSGSVVGEQTVTDLQPLRHETDSFFDFDCELESPGSPVDECEYLRLIESTSNTPHNSAAESGYSCASATSSNSSLEGQFFDTNSENESSTAPLKQHQHKPLRRLYQRTVHNNKDEVDFNNTEMGPCNGYQNHEDLTQTLPSERPNPIELAKSHNDNQNIEKQISMSQSVQAEILKELHEQSKVCEHEEENGNKSISQEPPKMETEMDVAVAVNEAVAVTVESERIVRNTNRHTTNVENDSKTQVAIEELKQSKAQAIEDSEENKATLSKDANENEVCKTETDKHKISHSHMETTDDEDDRPQRVRRCSSLKTGKTPPGTPSRKKIVRFADVLGLDLADVKTFLDEIPNIPKSAYEDLEILETETPIQLGPRSDKLLMPLFQQPGGLANFLDMVREKLVSLENAAVTDVINQTITGSVRVRNLDFHKSVHIRYSLDGWRSFADLQANYVENSCDGFSDKFSFVLFGNSMHIGQRLEFAVRFQCKGHQYWDNNYGANYCFQCLPAAAPSVNSITAMLPSHHSNTMIALLSPTVGESWCSSFY